MPPCSPYNCLIPFRIGDIDEIEEGGGVYGFWYNNKWCLYVGKAQSIKKRLMDYWNVISHNDDLKNWIDVHGTDIKIAYQIISDPKARHKRERLYIERYSPITNRTN